MSRNINWKQYNGVLVAATVLDLGVAHTLGKCYGGCRLQNKDASAVMFFTEDGSDPSAANGTQLIAGQSYEFHPEQLPNNPLKLYSAGTPRYNLAWS